MSNEKFKFSKAYPSKHLRCPDLEGKEATLTIKSWEYPTDELDKGGDGKVMKGTVILFNETPKRLVANVTNFNAIANIHGRDPDHWKGKKITLYPSTTTLGKDKAKPCIRVKGEFKTSL